MNSPFGSKRSPGGVGPTDHVEQAWRMPVGTDIPSAYDGSVEARGLGICYMGTTLYRADDLVGLLELPETVMPVTGLVVAWPDEAPRAVTACLRPAGSTTSAIGVRATRTSSASAASEIKGREHDMSDPILHCVPPSMKPA